VIVVDSSVMIGVLGGKADTTRLLVDEALVAPQVLDAEVGHALRRKTMVTKELSLNTAVKALEVFTATEIRRYDHLDLMGRAWQLRENLSFYDALYVALAEMLEAPLVTVDARIAKAPGIPAIVQILPLGA
jgi:predicted nucleic acid-binding protein